ncbi:hypothetical protein SAMN04489832_3390 [Micromonospora cremea]|uniref:Uncharacterized protein n=1 Tax=Micromonospora cremea TaxID=709881 RepID=A0A1N5YXF1_9ACTN|nr:hypothetical protein SAMN04489832_3390 [Micromonospora cremea]
MTGGGVTWAPTGRISGAFGRASTEPFWLVPGDLVTWLFAQR